MVIVRRILTRPGYDDEHVHQWCFDAPNIVDGEVLTGYRYLVKGLADIENEDDGWWWCEECLRKRGMLW